MPDLAVEEAIDQVLEIGARLFAERFPDLFQAVHQAGKGRQFREGLGPLLAERRERDLLGLLFLGDGDQLFRLEMRQHMIIALVPGPIMVADHR